VVTAVLCVAFCGVFASADGGEYINPYVAAETEGERKLSEREPSEPVVIHVEELDLYASAPVDALAETSIDQSLVDYLAAGCEAGLEQVPLYTEGYRVSAADLKSLIIYMKYDHPELFYLANSYKYSSAGEYVYSYYPVYMYSSAEMAAAKQEFDALLDALMAHAPRFATDFEELLYYHDYIVANFEYDTDYQIYDAYNMLKQRKGVCQAYTMLYASILDRLGIENTAALSDGMNHVWNVVLLDGEWFFTDLTWDDPIADEKGRVFHTHFLRSAEYFTSDGYYGWRFVDGEERELSDKYADMFYYEVYQVVHIWKGGLFYFDYKDCFMKRIDSVTGECEPLFYVDTRTYIQGTASYYDCRSTGFCGYADKLYYGAQNGRTGTFSIYEYNVDTGEKKTLYTFECKQGTAESVYRMFVWENTVYYLRSDNPYDTGSGTIDTFEVEKYAGSAPVLMDINGDGEITNIDLVMLVRYLSGWDVDGFAAECADANSDNKINNRDAIEIIRRLAA